MKSQTIKLEPYHWVQQMHVGSLTASVFFWFFFSIHCIVIPSRVNLKFVQADKLVRLF